MDGPWPGRLPPSHPGWPGRLSAGVQVLLEAVGGMTLAPFTSAVIAEASLKREDRPADLREYQQRARFSRRESQPLEKLACGTVHLYRLDDGRLLTRRVDCRTKACRKCGPRLRQEYARGYAQVLAAAGPIHRQVVGPGWRKRPGTEYLRI